MLALARKYRPKRFADVAVQSHVSATLKGAIARGRVAHGYLLCGPRGVGKTTLARVLAMALNCERREESERQTGPDAGEPCGECQSCRRIWSGSASLDVVEIDAASNRGVDDARELRERAMYAPSGERDYKIYIIDEAHMLTREAWNALLKILEEPPPRVVFVFATTEPQKIAQAAAPVLSRLQRFDFKRIGPAEIRDRLARVLADEGITAEPEALAAIARAADGSMRDGLSLTDQVLAMGDGRITAERVRESLGLIPEDEFIALLDVIAQRRAADVFGVVARLAEAGIDFGGFLGGLGDILRAQLAVVLGGRAADASERMRVALDERKDNFTAADLLRMLAALSELEPRFRKSAQQQLLIETLLVRFALLDRSVELEQVLQTLGGTRGPVAEGRGSGASGDKGSSGARGSGNPRTLGDAVAPSAPPMRADRQEPPNDPPIRGGAPSRPEARATHAPMAFAAPAVASLPAATPFAAPSPRPVAAPTPPSSGDLPALDLNRVTGRWDELVEHLKADGKPLILIAALKHARPVAVTARGDVAIELDEPNDIYDRAVSDGCPDVRVVLRSWFAGVERVFLRRDERAGAAPPPKRLTNEMVRAERLASLRKRDPLLEAAIDALDLDVAD